MSPAFQLRSPQLLTGLCGLPYGVCKLPQALVGSDWRASEPLLLGTEAISATGQKATIGGLVKTVRFRWLSGHFMSAFTADGDFVRRLPTHPLRADAPTDPSFDRLVARSGHSVFLLSRGVFLPSTLIYPPIIDAAGRGVVIGSACR